MSNLGKWNPWYSHLPPDVESRSYGVSDSYRIGAEWLADCEQIEDWGCGLGYLRRFVSKERYVGIDGTQSPFSDLVLDLAIHRTLLVPGIFMRGVIEHDWRWKDILDNALRSFTKKFCLVLFTPMSTGATKEIAYNQEIGVPDISFSHLDILERVSQFPEVYGDYTDISSETAYGHERIFYFWRK